MNRKIFVITAACFSLTTTTAGICASAPSEVTRLERVNSQACANIADIFTSMVSQQLGISENEIYADASFDDDLGADSLDRVELLMNVEEEFNIIITDEEAEKITTVNAALELIEEKCKRE